MKLKANGMHDRSPFLRENHINEGTYKQTKRERDFQKIGYILFVHVLDSIQNKIHKICFPFIKISKFSSPDYFVIKPKYSEKDLFLLFVDF